MDVAVTTCYSVRMERVNEYDPAFIAQTVFLVFALFFSGSFNTSMRVLRTNHDLPHFGTNTSLLTHVMKPRKRYIDSTSCNQNSQIVRIGIIINKLGRRGWLEHGRLIVTPTASKKTPSQHAKIKSTVAYSSLPLVTTK